MNSRRGLQSLTSLYLCLCTCCLVRANVEKVIFVAPPSIPIFEEAPNLASLHLPILSHNATNLRTHLPAIFPTRSHSRGHESWYMLHELTAGDRYETRLCWPASQPSGFKLEVYTVPEVFQNNSLITSLMDYSKSRQDEGQANLQPLSLVKSETSVMLLQISAWADYFSTNKTLMENVAPVHVEIILDQFVWFGVLPRSLQRTVFYICLLIPIAYFVSQWVIFWALDVCRAFDEVENSKKKQDLKKKS